MEQDRFEKDNKVERRLAAILHADVVGYSRLMGQDEVGTHRVLVSALDAISALIEKHDGKVVNFAGTATEPDWSRRRQLRFCASERLCSSARIGLNLSRSNI